MTRKPTLRALTAGLTTLALTLALTLTPAKATKTTYSDVNGNIWYSDSVLFCQRHALMDGLSSRTFDPDGLMTRAVLAEALYRLAGRPEPEAGEELPFPDVGKNHPNLNAIRWAKANGVVSGYDNGDFGPEDPITREQIAALLWNQQGQQEAQASASFTDQADVSDWASGAVDWAYSVKLMQGTETGSFLPLNNTTRAQGAVIVMNYAKTFYGLQLDYTLPAPQTVAANQYISDAYSLDENGYLSYSAAPFTRGIDVSAHQKEIDWQKVAATGMSFAMVRAGYRGYGSGAVLKDFYFDANMRGALSNGMEVGVYFFSQALTPAEAVEEANQLLEWIGDYPVTYPVVFDWEEQDYDDSRTQGADGNTVTACALAFCKVIEDAGYIPMAYGSPTKVYSGGILLEYLQDYPFWLANYTRNTAPTTFRYHYNIWQYSSTGRVDGINGNVDLNICFTDWTTWSTGGVHEWWKGPV